MDYLDTLPGARVFRLAEETREAIRLTTPEAIRATFERHHDALSRLSKL